MFVFVGDFCFFFLRWQELLIILTNCPRIATFFYNVKVLK